MKRRFWGVAQPVEQRALVSRVGSSNLPSPTKSQPGLLSGRVWDRRQVLRGLLALPAVKYFLPPVKGWRPWENDFTTGNLVYKGTERYSWGATDVRAFYGTAG